MYCNFIFSPVKLTAFLYQKDSPSGIKAARAAGLAVFGVLSGHDSEKLIEAGATLTISDFNDKALWQALE